jgi:hypothetical protein
VAVLTRAEATELSERFADRAQAHQADAARALSEQIAKSTWVVVKVYEWES